MPGFLNFEAKRYRDILGRFARRTEILEAGRREAMRDAGRKALKAVFERAPKKTGLFAQGLFYRTYDRGHATQMKLYSGGEHGFLLNFIRYGTRPHVIPRGGSAAQMAKGYPLSFYWEKGPAGPGRYSFWSVNHPGTKPNPFVEDAMGGVEEDILTELRQVAASVARG